MISRNLKTEIMFLKVTDLAYLEAYKLELHFNDGTIKDVDLKNEL